MTYCCQSGSAFASACFDASAGAAPCLGVGVTTSSGSTLCLPGGNCSCIDTILADASPIVTASLCNSQQLSQGGWDTMCTVPVDANGVYVSSAHYDSFSYCQLACSDAGYPLEGWAEFCAPAPPPPMPPPPPPLPPPPPAPPTPPPPAPPPPPFTPTSVTDNNSGGSDGLSLGALIGIIVGGAFGCLIGLALAVALLRKSKLVRVAVLDGKGGGSADGADDVVAFKQSALEGGGEGGGKLSSAMSVESVEDDETWWEEETSAEIRRLAAKMPDGAFTTELAVESRYAAEVRSLVFGHPAEAALGIGHFLKIEPGLMRSGMNEGVAKIEAEIAAHGTDEDKECLYYILREAAGSSDKDFLNGRRDVERNGERFDYFVHHKISKNSKLEAAHVLALRLYSTAVYKSINTPLRDTARQGAHPLAVTVAFVDEGVRRLRSVGARERTKSGRISTISEQTLWRGMRNASVPDEFHQQGGTELAPMSTTADLAVALQYSASKNPVLLRLATSSFMDRGADISFLSAFPSEKEVLYPPLTFLAPTGKVSTTEIGDATVKVIEVKPNM